MSAEQWRFVCYQYDHRTFSSLRGASLGGQSGEGLMSQHCETSNGQSQSASGAVDETPPQRNHSELRRECEQLPRKGCDEEATITTAPDARKPTPVTAKKATPPRPGFVLRFGAPRDVSPSPRADAPPMPLPLVHAVSLPRSAAATTPQPQEHDAIQAEDARSNECGIEVLLPLVVAGESVPRSTAALVPAPAAATATFADSAAIVARSVSPSTLFANGSPRFASDTDASMRRRVDYSEHEARTWFCQNPLHHVHDGILSPQEVAVAAIGQHSVLEPNAQHVAAVVSSLQGPQEFSYSPSLSPGSRSRDVSVTLKRIEQLVPPPALLSDDADEKEAPDDGCGVGGAAPPPRWWMLHRLGQQQLAKREEAAIKAAIERQNAEEAAMQRDSVPFRARSAPKPSGDSASADQQRSSSLREASKSPVLAALLEGRASVLDKKPLFGVEKESQLRQLEVESRAQQQQRSASPAAASPPRRSQSKECAASVDHHFAGRIDELASSDDGTSP